MLFGCTQNQPCISHLVEGHFDCALLLTVCNELVLPCIVCWRLCSRKCGVRAAVLRKTPQNCIPGIVDVRMGR